MFTKKKKAFLVFVALTTVLTACTGGGGDSSDDSSLIPESSSVPISSEDSSLPPSSSEEKLDFTGVSFPSKQVTYDGNEHRVEVEGAPDETNITYTPKNNYTDVGTYDVTALITKEGYNNLTLTAQLKIIAANIKGVEFKNKNVEYDGNPHTITITGNPPDGFAIVYRCLNAEGTNTFTEPGEYEVEARITCLNYNDLVLVATLTITSELEDLYSFVAGNNKVYFQNALHKEYLYSYDDTEGVKFVNTDKAQYFTELNNEIYYVNSSLLSNNITKHNYTENTRSVIAQYRAKELTDDGTNLYFVERPLIGDKGVYKLSTNAEDEPTKIALYAGKAYDLQYENGYLYFIDKDDRLVRINTTNQNQTPTVVLADYKIKNLFIHEGVFYFTINKVAGDYLAKYHPTTQKLVKLTSDAAGSMAIIGNYIYYTNVDKLNTLVFGKGIYRVRHDVVQDTSAPGQNYLSDENKDYEFTSLQASGNNLYFYRVYDKSIYRLNVETKESTNLLEGFEAPEQTVLPKDGISAFYGNRLYYQNIYDADKLYVYDTKTKTNTRVTSSAIDDLYIYGDELYYRQVSYFVNKDLYKIDLKSTNPPILISKNDCGELEIYNNKIYYINYSGSNTINRMNLDGTGDEVIYDDEAYNLRAYQGKLYFIINATAATTGKIRYLTIPNSGPIVGEPVEMDNTRTSFFEIYQDKIYFRRVYGFAYASKALARTDLLGNNLETLAASIDPYDFAFGDGKICFYNDITGDPGIFYYNFADNKVERINNDYGSNLHYKDGYLYYYNHRAIDGDSHLYEYDLALNKKVQIDML